MSKKKRVHIEINGVPNHNDLHNSSKYFVISLLGSKLFNWHLVFQHTKQNELRYIPLRNFFIGTSFSNTQKRINYGTYR